jgi:hypothetical protein
MDLLDRYLQAVKKHLPWKRQDDIIAELKVNLESQLEEKEAELGRPLTEDEASDWLREMGPPLKVAAGYQRQQYLIGPAVFPTFWFVLRMAWFWVTLVFLIGHAVQIATSSQGWISLWYAVIQLPFVVMMTAAWVTLIFAIIEFTAAHSSKRWGLTPLPLPTGIRAPCPRWTREPLREKDRAPTGVRLQKWLLASSGWCCCC